jgi:hypothetical protein
MIWYAIIPSRLFFLTNITALINYNFHFCNGRDWSWTQVASRTSNLTPFERSWHRSSSIALPPRMANFTTLHINGANHLRNRRPSVVITYIFGLFFDVIKLPFTYIHSIYFKSPFAMLHSHIYSMYNYNVRAMGLIL